MIGPGRRGARLRALVSRRRLAALVFRRGLCFLSRAKLGTGESLE
jgi:hypothetical protein